jgi:hypothetical protein
MNVAQEESLSSDLITKWPRYAGPHTGNQDARQRHRRYRTFVTAQRIQTFRGLGTADCTSGDGADAGTAGGADGP